MGNKAKEKAEYLVDKYYWIFGDGYLGEQHIQCAILCVEEVIKALQEELDSGLNNDFSIMAQKGFYMEVLTELKQM